MRKLAAVVLAVSMVFGSVACHKKTPMPEPPVVVYQRTLLAGADATNIVASALQTVDEARKKLYASGQIEATSNTALLTFLKSVAVKNEAAVQTLKLAQEGGEGAQINWRKALVDVANSAQNLDPTLFGIKNPDAQKTLQAALAALQAAAQVINASFN